MTNTNPLWDFLHPSQIRSEQRQAAQKPSIQERDQLPFSSIDGRRFELLSYLLITDDPDFCSANVLLGKSTGDQGRDVTIFVDNALHTVIQCKNLEVPFTKPALVHELLKIALHNLEDRALLGSGVNYEIWATSGLTGPASKLITLWPEGWIESEIRAAFDKVIAHYEKLSKRTWADCKGYLLNEFPALIRPRTVDGLSLSLRVRRKPSLLDQFFQASFVVPVDVVAKLLGIEDFGALIELLKTYPPNQRLHLGAHFFGLTPFHFQLMTKDERDAVLRASGESVHVCTKTLLTSVARHAKREVKRLFEAKFKHPASRYIVDVVIVERLAMACSRMTAAGIDDVGLAKFADFPLEDHLQQRCRASWRDCEASIHAYDPSLHDVESNEAKRAYIARLLRQGADSEELFCATLMAELTAELAGLKQLNHEILDLIPYQMLIISNSSPFDSRFIRQMAEDSKRIQDLLDAKEDLAIQDGEGVSVGAGDDGTGVGDGRVHGGTAAGDHE